MPSAMDFHTIIPDDDIETTLSEEDQMILASEELQEIEEGISVEDVLIEPEIDEEDEDEQDFTFINAEPTMSVTTVATAKASRNAKGTFAKFVAPDIAEEVVASYLEGMTIAQVAQKFLIAPNVLGKFFHMKGIIRPKGSSPNRRSYRPRTTNILTPEVLATATEMVKEIGIVNTAKKMNLNAVELSGVLKNAGMTFRRGRPSLK